MYDSTLPIDADYNNPLISGLVSAIAATRDTSLLTSLINWVFFYPLRDLTGPLDFSDPNLADWLNIYEGSTMAEVAALLSSDSGWKQTYKDTLSSLLTHAEGIYDQYFTAKWKGILPWSQGTIWDEGASHFATLAAYLF
jgi:hypothetical protein